MIWWNGTSSDDVHVTVERYPERRYPARKVMPIQIPGRNGDLLIDEGTYYNYDQPFDIFINARQQLLPRVAREVSEWLYVSGYKILTDSYEPDVFRLAHYTGPTDIENVLNRYGKATIIFNCQPFRFRFDGTTPVTLTASGTLHNAYHQSQPKITVYGTGGTVTIGNQTITLSAIDGYTVIDDGNAYKGTANKNNTVSMPDQLFLKHGDNMITLGTGITSVEIVPRWCVL